MLDRILTVPANGADGITVALTAYTDGDVVGGLLTFDIPTAMGGGKLNRVRLVDEDSQDEPYLLYLFNDTPTTIVDDAAFAPAIDDLRKLVAVVSISSATTVNSLDYWHSAVLNYAFTCPRGKLFGYLVANGGTPDYTNADALAIYLEVESEG